MRHLTIIWLLLVLLAGCSGDSEQTILAYNALGRGQHLNLVVNGYIVGIEKYPREKIGDPEPGYPDKFKLLPNPNNNKLISEQNQEFVKATSNPKAMLVTQVVSYFPDRSNHYVRNYLYNAYSSSLEGDKNYKEGYEALRKLKYDLKTRLIKAYQAGKPYTHLIIMSMGWNNDQYVSIDRYNRILENLNKMASTEGDNTFRPLVIGITWPSAWFTISDSWLWKKIVGHIGSYTNKSNDADEIGYTIINWLINHQLPDIKQAVGKAVLPKVVAIGHSMGARLLSRAIFSKEYLKDPPSTSVDPVDIFIGLQGAFSARRFVATDSIEGAPYANYKLLRTTIILTSSENDKANPSAFWSKHVGGKNGLVYMRKHPEVFDVFIWRKQKKQVEAAIQKYIDNKKIIALDVKEIVTGTDAHNDILDMDIAELIWFCLNKMPKDNKT